LVGIGGINQQVLTGHCRRLRRASALALRQHTADISLRGLGGDDRIANSD
jgi:hypothetical protein